MVVAAAEMVMVMERVMLTVMMESQIAVADFYSRLRGQYQSELFLLVRSGKKIPSFKDLVIQLTTATTATTKNNNNNYRQQQKTRS